MSHASIPFKSNQIKSNSYSSPSSILSYILPPPVVQSLFTQMLTMLIFTSDKHFGLADIDQMGAEGGTQ